MRRRDGCPQWIDEAQQQVVPLKRADLGGTSASAGYSEAWLQDLLHRRPEIFPIEQIEPGFGDLIPLCRELPLVFGGGRSGALDNLYATAGGGLVLIEAKLWRNPEARRAVVAQAMEYAGAIFRMSYEQLQQAVLKARVSTEPAARSLFEIVSEKAGVDEAEFVDALSRNLQRGRAVIAIVGDGIREDIAPLAELLQSHAGHRFTFALVELAVYETPVAGARMVVPSVLAQTQLIERGVIKFDSNLGAVQVNVEEAPASAVGQTRSRSFGIGEDEFFEELGRRDAALPALLKAFLAKADALGIYTELKGGMSLKHPSPEGQPLNMGTIRKDGFVDTGPSTWWDRKASGQVYNETLAACIGGHVNEMMDGSQSALRTATNKTPRLSDLLPVHELAWLNAMEKYITDRFGASDAA